MRRWVKVGAAAAAARVALARASAIAALFAVAFAISPTTAGAAESAPARAPNATVQQPRSFGYSIGDIVTQRVRLNLDGREFVPAELPSPGRLGVWFERRSSRIETDDGGHRWLTVNYQLMNSPQALAVVTLPAWKIESKESGGAELRVAPWRMTVAPMSAKEPLTQAGLGTLRPDRAASTVALEPIQRSLALALAAFAATVIAWLAWWLWRNRQASASRPFAIALREMRTADDTAPEAWYALHRAFDATAGRATRVETLPVLFQRAPQLEPLRPAIERFFDESASRFFTGQKLERPLHVRSLCRQLRQIEKRHDT